MSEKTSLLASAVLEKLDASSSLSDVTAAIGAAKSAAELEKVNMEIRTASDSDAIRMVQSNRIGLGSSGVHIREYSIQYHQLANMMRIHSGENSYQHSMAKHPAQLFETLLCLRAYVRSLILGHIRRMQWN